jgi:hypothetical protein
MIQALRSLETEPSARPGQPLAPLVHHPTAHKVRAWLLTKECPWRGPFPSSPSPR